MLHCYTNLCSPDKISLSVSLVCLGNLEKIVDEEFKILFPNTAKTKLPSFGCNFKMYELISDDYLKKQKNA